MATWKGSDACGGAFFVGINKAVENHQVAMTLQLGREVTLVEELHSSLGKDGINKAVENCQSAMTLEVGREVTIMQAHSSLGAMGGRPLIDNGRGTCEKDECEKLVTRANLKLC